MKKKKLKRKDDEDYQKLVKDISALMDDAKAKGFDMRFARFDLLTCKSCGAHEDESFQGVRFTVLPNGKTSQRKEFIVIERKDRSYHRSHMVYCTTHYRFICGACGKLQLEIFKERFNNKELFE